MSIKQGCVFNLIRDEIEVLLKIKRKVYVNIESTSTVTKVRVFISTFFFGKHSAYIIFGL